MSAVNALSRSEIDLAQNESYPTDAVLQPPVLQPYVDSARYAKCVEVSKRIRWDIDRDVIRDRVTSAQMQRVGVALAPLVDATRWAS